MYGRENGIGTCVAKGATRSSAQLIIRCRNLRAHLPSEGPRSRPGIIGVCETTRHEDVVITGGEQCAECVVEQRKPVSRTSKKGRLR